MVTSLWPQTSISTWHVQTSAHMCVQRQNRYSWSPRTLWLARSIVSGALLPAHICARIIVKKFNLKATADRSLRVNLSFHWSSKRVDAWCCDDFLFRSRIRYQSSFPIWAHRTTMWHLFCVPWHFIPQWSCTADAKIKNSVKGSLFLNLEEYNLNIV